ncbi:hypothetical protein KVV02_002575 [Mortierella alpina]|uniref:Protein kinase domain-containing protein n=1 Tax=Mortierella alpina TaxID=64518 RepID=A0A9P8A5Y7_MORAP|nr:hypothetical protein KVV02_002575 [Mortierella alpina]
MTFSIPQPIPSRSSHPVHAHQRPPIRRSQSHTVASSAHPAGSANNAATKFSFSHLYDHHLHSDVGDDLNLVNEEDESRVDDDDEDNDEDEDVDDMDQVRHDSGHYADLDLSTKGRGIPIGKPSFHFDDGHSFKKTRDHLLGHMGGSVGSRSRLSEDLHSRGRYGYGQSQVQSQSQSHSHSNSDSHSSVNLMANNLKTTHSLTLDTPANGLITSNLSKFRHDDRTESDNTPKQHHPVSNREQQDRHDAASAYNVPAASTGITIPQRAFRQGDGQSSQPLPSRHTSEHSSDKRSSIHTAAPPHPNISIDTSKACLQKTKTPASHTTTDSLFTEALKPVGAAKTLSTGSTVKAQPEGQLALGLRTEDRVSPPSTFGSTVGLASNSSTRPLMMNTQSRHSSALPPTPMFHHQAATALEPQPSSTLLPSLSPSSPRANSALVNSLEQLSVSWKAPEHTPSFPINRLHRSRTISSGTRPSLHSSFSSNGSTNSTNPYQNSLMSPTTMVTSSSYSSLPYSPAVAFLSNFVEVTAPRMAPDEEGEQVGEFIMGKIIGHGGFSLVREAFAIHLDGMVAQVAVKIVKTQTGATDNDRVQRMLDKEVAIWSRLSHPNVLPFLAVEKLPTDTFVFCELCTGGHLLDFITRQEASSYVSPRAGATVGLEEGQARLIFNQIAEAVRYLHEEKRIVHRDIKLENILQHEDGTWKICDFGLAEYQNDEAASYFGSPVSSSSNGGGSTDRDGCFSETEEADAVGGSLAYCSPEQLRSPTPLKCPSSDVWSLGVVLYALLTGRLPFQDEYEPRLQYQILNGRYEDPTECSAEARDLLKNMFRSKPEDRWRIGQVMDSPWCMGTTLAQEPEYGSGFGGHNSGSHASANNFFASFRA